MSKLRRQAHAAARSSRQSSSPASSQPSNSRSDPYTGRCYLPPQVASQITTRSTLKAHPERHFQDQKEGIVGTMEVEDEGSAKISTGHWVKDRSLESGWWRVCCERRSFMSTPQEQLFGHRENGVEWQTSMRPNGRIEWERRSTPFGPYAVGQDGSTYTMADDSLMGTIQNTEDGERGEILKAVAVGRGADGEVLTWTAQGDDVIATYRSCRYHTDVDHCTCGCQVLETKHLKRYETWDGWESLRTMEGGPSTQTTGAQALP